MPTSVVSARVVRYLVALAGAAALAVLPASVGSAAPPDSGAAAPPTVAELAQHVAALNQQLDKAVEVYDQAVLTVTRSHARQKRLTIQEKAQERRVSVAKHVVSAFASSAYEAGGLTPMASLLGSGSPQNFLDQMATLNRLSHDQRERVDQLIAAQKTLAGQQKQIAAELATQRAAEQTAAHTKAQLQRNLAKAQQLVAAEKAAARKAAAERSVREQAAAEKVAAERSAREQAAAARAAREQAAAARAVSEPARSTTARATSAGPAPAPVPTTPPAGSAAAAVSFAYAQLGKPYGWGATGPGSYDCSGLTLAAWRAAGISLPHSSAAQYGSSPQVPLSSLRPGDLIFYGSPIHHVAIYIGGGQVIHAPVPGEVVQISPLNLESPVGAVRP